MKQHQSYSAAIAQLLICLALHNGRGEGAPPFERSPPLLRAMRKTPQGLIGLKAFQIRGGDRPVWATVGRVSLARVGDRVFRRNDGGGGGGFSAHLLLGTDADAKSLAEAAKASECQIVRPPLTEVACAANVRLPEGFEVQVSGFASDLPSEDGWATVLVQFNSLGGVWSEAALSDLEERGEVTCRLRSDRLPAFNGMIVRLSASEAVNLTAVMAQPRRPCADPRDSVLIDMAAVYNFRGEWHADNLVDTGRYKVTARGGARFTAEGAVMMGPGWLDIDTEGGSLTEHMKYDSQWSVFFVYKRSPVHNPNRRVPLFSVHRAGNPLACSILAWTSGPSQTAVYTRVHNVASGFAVAQTTGRMLDSRPDAWNRVGISYGGDGRVSVTVNGAEAASEAGYRFPSYSTWAKDGLRGALSVGLVRGPEQAMLGAFRCFGVARGFVRPEHYHGLFEKYCQ